MKKEKIFGKRLKIVLLIFWTTIIALIALFSFAPKWETYSHQHFGFQFRYPSHYQIKEYVFFDGLSLEVVDPKMNLTYLKIQVFGLPETAVEMQIPENPLFTGPYPRKIPATEKAGEQTVLERNFNGISGVEVFGKYDEGFNFSDSFHFIKNDYEWMIYFNPVGEGRTDETLWIGSGPPIVFNKDIYLKIRDSFFIE